MVSLFAAQNVSVRSFGIFSRTNQNDNPDPSPYLVGIFHCGVGPTRDARRIIVSIYSDGLSYAPGLKNAPPSLLPIRKYRPWAYRQNPVDFTIELTNPGLLNNGETPIQQNKSNAKRDRDPSFTSKDSTQITNRVRNVIQALIDQPGECLRDDIDSLDFSELELRDLSTATPPGFEEDEWMLVDTPLKMRQCVRELEVGTYILIYLTLTMLRRNLD
jgi:hypothetical protein